jgi:predicted transposase/invertase (TIGR01784 family)
MSEDTLHQPHDKLFKAGFSVPENAAAFLSTQFPESLSKHIDWDGLRLEPGSFVDEAFRHSESDLLFATTLSGHECRVYILFEHQRSKDAWIALRLLRYQLGIWERFRAANPSATRLPLILPVVLAQNTHDWELKPRFSALLDLPASLTEDWAEWLPEAVFQLVQLAQIPFDKILGTPSGILVLRTLKAEQTQELLSDAIWDESLLTQLPAELFRSILTYIFTNPQIDRISFLNTVSQIRDQSTKTTAMTLAEQFRIEGRQEGRQEGLSEGLSEGHRVGMEKGSWVGKVQMLRDLMVLSAPTDTELAECTVEALKACFTQLQSEYDRRHKQ